MYLNKWFKFISERFHPTSYLTMVIFFVVAHYGVYFGYFTRNSNFDIGKALLLLLGSITFFFMLRLSDEIKDYDHDVQHHPNRPLPRGLLHAKDLSYAIAVGITLEAVVFSLLGVWAIATMLVAILYFILMYKEFFVSRWLRAHLATYAVTHTFVVVIFSITVFSSLANRPFWEFPSALCYFALASWFLFNIFEFGRKTFATKEERGGIDSYSRNFGRAGAVGFAVAMGLLSLVLVNLSISGLFEWELTWFGVLLLAGILYLSFDTMFSAIVYRKITTVYIVLTYATISIFQLRSLLI